jgi:hypothetical protein
MMRPSSGHNGVASFANDCTYLMMKSWVLIGPGLTLEGAVSYKYAASHASGKNERVWLYFLRVSLSVGVGNVLLTGCVERLPRNCARAFLMEARSGF